MHFCILEVCHNATPNVVFITSVLYYFIAKFPEVITLAVMQIFRLDRKRWIGNDEKYTFIGRLKIVTPLRQRENPTGFLVINNGECNMNCGIRSQSSYLIPIPIQNGTTDLSLSV